MAIPKASYVQLPRRSPAAASGSRALRRARSGCSSETQKCDEAACSSSHFARQSSPGAGTPHPRGTGSAPWLPGFSGAFQRSINSLVALNGMTLSEPQMKLLKRATAVLADVLAGRGAAPSVRLTVRRALRAAALAALTATHLARLCTLAGSLAHAVDFSHGGLATEAELANAVCTLLGPTVGTASPPLLRAVGPVSALAADGLDLGAAVLELAQHLTENHNHHHPAELAAAAAGLGKVLDLLVDCSSTLESGQQLVEVVRGAVGVSGGGGRKGAAPQQRDVRGDGEGAGRGSGVTSR
ncbi:hypothetical protein PLESTF_001530200 [Pleodorina starrii]|nr:hypothetical protein PLESTF_001530200 [Pleodorina starrii]